MKPFRAWYFVRHNLRRISTVLFMIALTGLLYVGGSYLSNIEVECVKVINTHEEFAFVFNSGDDMDGSQLEALLAEVEADETLRIIPVGVNQFNYPTTLGFQNGDAAFSYTVEDFLWVNERLGLVEDVSLIKDNTLFLTERSATYFGLTDGDLFTENRDEIYFYYGTKPYTVRIMEGNRFGVCLVAEDSGENRYYHLTWSEKGNQESFGKRLEELKTTYNNLSIRGIEERREEVDSFFAINGVIFLCIIVVVTCVFFITVNAVLVGIYEKRKNEFRIYESIGIPRKKIYKKVVGELVLMSGIGMVLSLLLAFVAITLLNLFVYEKNGLQLYYYHSWAFGSWIICNAMILVPSILLRIRGIARNRETV
ncbi:MAG: ABC transporter permease [Lachnospiraceae bacterium]|nr:ABC transporter permease [Lachnospiraceae bacterium]